MTVIELGFIRRLLIRLLKPINKLMGHLHIAPHERAIRASDIFKIEEVIQPGDVIISYSKGELTNYFIGCEFNHAAIYTGIGVVVEAVGNGVHKLDLEDFCASKDRVCVLRAKFCTGLEAFNAAKLASEQCGRPYDYAFEPNEKAFYCAELVTYCYQKATNNTSPFKPRMILGVATVYPQDFKDAADKFEIVIERPTA